MRPFVLAFALVLAFASPGLAVDFLGVELCKGSVDTSVFLPVGSPLSLESAEIGRHGGLLLLLKTNKGSILDQLDEMMSGFTGAEGTGDEKKLQWSGNGLAAYAQVIKKDYAALAVSSEDDCRAPEVTVATDERDPETAPKTGAEPAPVVAGATAATVETGTTTPAPSIAEVETEFELKGQLRHSQTEGSWVDVMGIVINRSGTDFKVANFDLSSYDAAGELICVDAISVSQLRNGQERAFRDSIRCTDYVRESIASWKLQFSGGH